MPVTLTRVTARLTAAQAAALERPLAAIVRAALALERKRPGEIGIVLAEDALLRELNRDYRKLDRATDVLSFVYEEPGAAVSGDLVISIDRALEQAGRFRVSLGAELARLVVHGTLHLAGLDHHAAGERRHMRAREEAALASSARSIAALERALLSASPARAARGASPRARRRRRA